MAGLLMGAVALLASWAPEVARASEAPGATGHGLQAAAPAALATGMRRLVPNLVTMAAHAEADGAWLQALDAALGEADDAVRQAYRGRTEALFAGDEGLTGAGEVALAWLKRADAHVADRAIPWARRAVEGAERPAEGERRRGAPAIEVTREALLEAWRGSDGQERRLLEVARRLGRQGPMRAAVEALAAHLTASSRARAELEVALASGLAALVADVRPRPRTTGVHVDADGYYASPDTLWRDDPSPALTADEAGALLAAAGQGAEALEAWLRARTSPLPEYQALVEATERYAKLCAAGGWAPLPVPRVKRGAAWTDAEAIEAVQRRLALEGFWEGEPTGVFDEATVAALGRYRAARHLPKKKTWDEEVAAELNVPCEDRLAVLRLNVRRWRHSARTDEKTFVMVNIPGFRARFVADGETRVSKRVVVGAGTSYWDAERKRRIFRNATPILHDYISQVVVNPSWTLPNRVIRNEIKPKMAKDPEYLEKNRYVIKQGASGQEIFVQLPGPGNALGTVKMLFPNSESVYMHDTNRPGFFNYPRRDFSHGCVRVHEAMEFAHTLLDHDAKGRAEGVPSLGRLKTLARKDSERTFWYPIQAPIPVFLEYYTASVGRDGVVLFHPDVYDYDKATLGSGGGAR